MPAKKHNFTVAEIKAGIMVFAGLTVFVLFVAVIEGYRPKGRSQTFVCYFKDTLGLNRGADVRFGGVKVGRVQSIAPDAKRPSTIRVEAVVPPELRINKECGAYISQTTLTAEKHLEIGTGSEEAERLPTGSEIPVHEGDLFNQAGQVAGGLKDVLDDVRTLLGVKEAREAAEKEGPASTVATLFEGVDRAVHEGTELVTDARTIVGDHRQDLKAVVERLKTIEDSTQKLMDQMNGVVGENRDNLHATIAQAPHIAEQLAALAESLDEIGASLQATLDNSRQLTGTAGAALNDYRPVIEDTLIDLKQTVRHLRDFSETIAKEPQSVIRGANPPGRRAN
jgi:phospholipid/cholesterol/gamma-HCH transport system substrate-binding protein